MLSLGQTIQQPKAEAFVEEEEEEEEEEQQGSSQSRKDELQKYAKCEQLSGE